MRDIAILMMIHKYTEQQRTLITHLANDFDVYVHIDKRTKIDLQKVAACGKNVTAVKKYKVYWAHHSQFFTTLFLLKKAYQVGYKRYILISGEDIPLKSNAEIATFFRDNKSEYFSYEKLPCTWLSDGGFRRIDQFYAAPLYRERFRFSERLSIGMATGVFCILNRIMRFLRIRRRMPIDYYVGSSWWNLTHGCVAQIFQYLQENPQFLKKFKYTSCGDELFFQTLILNFIHRVQCQNDNLRYIYWLPGTYSPYIFRSEDLSKLEADTHNLFARKFDCAVDAEIIWRCFERVEYQGSFKLR